MKHKKPWVVAIEEPDGSVRWIVTKGFWRYSIGHGFLAGVLVGFLVAIVYGVSQHWCGWTV